jgi:hypothetical protein
LKMREFENLKMISYSKSSLKYLNF